MFQAAYAELDVWKFQSMRELSLECLVACWHNGQGRLPQDLLNKE